MPQNITMYHSELRDTFSRVNVFVETDIMKSRYEGKPDYVMMKVGGMSRRYSIENPACAEVFNGQKGMTMDIEAKGKGDDASIEVYNVTNEGQPEPQQPQQPQPEPRQSHLPPAHRPAPSSQPEYVQPDNERESLQPSSAVDSEAEVAKMLNRIAKVYSRSYDAGSAVRAAVLSKHGDQMSEGHFQGMVTALYIEACRKGAPQMMKVGQINPEA
jgi:hypothetical protein